MPISAVLEAIGPQIHPRNNNRGLNKLRQKEGAPDRIQFRHSAQTPLVSIISKYNFFYSRRL